MKKLIAATAVLIAAASIFAVSYKNNTYQKLADEYDQKARIAFDAGEYDDAVEYSKKAAENASLSQAYIDSMMARHNAEQQLKLAANKIKWAEGIGCEKTFPMAYTAAKEAYGNAESAFGKEDFAASQDYAKRKN